MVEAEVRRKSWIGLLMVMTHVTDVGTVAVRALDADPLSATRSSGNVAQIDSALEISKGTSDSATEPCADRVLITTVSCGHKDCDIGIGISIGAVSEDRF